MVVYSTKLSTVIYERNVKSQLLVQFSAQVLSFIPNSQFNSVYKQCIQVVCAFTCNRMYCIFEYTKSNNIFIKTAESGQPLNGVVIVIPTRRSQKDSPLVCLLRIIT